MKDDEEQAGGERSTKLALVATEAVSGLLKNGLAEAGGRAVTIGWEEESFPVEALPEEADALVVCALRLSAGTRKLASLLVKYPRLAAAAAQEKGIRKIIYAVPEVRGIQDETGAALRASVVMMQHKYGAVVLRCGMLRGLGGAIEGWSTGPVTIIPGQGWGMLNVLEAEDLAAGLVALARGPVEENGRERSFGLASSEGGISLGDYIQLTRGGVIRLHIPVSVVGLLKSGSGESLEERALLQGGSAGVEANDSEKLIGKKADALSKFARGKVPRWLDTPASSQ
ncbi:MAG: hypothetical protein JW909_10020 [Planctomycetes bacterium]|nr:hypothetical protein [Planctomycetota bacterium]